MNLNKYRIHYKLCECSGNDDYVNVIYITSINKYAILTKINRCYSISILDECPEGYSINKDILTSKMLAVSITEQQYVTYFKSIDKRDFENVIADGLKECNKSTKKFYEIVKLLHKTNQPSGDLVDIIRIEMCDELKKNIEHNFITFRKQPYVQQNVIVFNAEPLDLNLMAYNDTTESETESILYMDYNSRIDFIRERADDKIKHFLNTKNPYVIDKLITLHIINMSSIAGKKLASMCSLHNKNNIAQQSDNSLIRHLSGTTGYLYERKIIEFYSELSSLFITEDEIKTTCDESVHLKSWMRSLVGSLLYKYNIKMSPEKFVYECNKDIFKLTPDLLYRRSDNVIPQIMINDIIYGVGIIEIKMKVFGYHNNDDVKRDGLLKQIANYYKMYLIDTDLYILVVCLCFTSEFINVFKRELDDYCTNIIKISPCSDKVLFATFDEEIF